GSLQAPVALDGGLFHFRPTAMTLLFEPLPCPDSVLRRLDPRWKLAALLLAAAAVALLRTWPAVLAALAGSLVLAALGRLPPRWYLARLAAPVLFVLLFAGPLPFLMPDADGPLWLGPVRVSPHGLAAAGVLVARAAAIVTLLLVLLATAPL